MPRLPHHARPAPTPTCGSWCPRGCPSASARCARWCCGRPARPSGGRWQVRAHRGRRPAHRGGRQRAAQGDRGAAAADGLPALHAVDPPGRHLGDHPVALPGRAAAPAAGRRGRRGAGRAATASPPDVAAWAAAAAQGHVGRARRLARDPEARERRRRGARRAAPADRRRRLLRRGVRADRGGRGGGRGVGRRDRRDASGRRWRPRSAPAAPAGARPARCAAPPGSSRSWRSRQKSRATRAQRDALDRALVDLAGFYRDVLATALRRAGRRRCTPTPPRWPAAAAQKWTPEGALRRLEAVLACRDGDRGQRQAADRRRGDDARPLAGLSPPLHRGDGYPQARHGDRRAVRFACR